jgi:hypothetical protein
MKWHADPDELMESPDSRTVRISRDVGENMKLTLYGVKNPEPVNTTTSFEPISKYEEARRWRGQMRDKNGRTVIANTMEYGYFQGQNGKSSQAGHPRKGKFSAHNIEQIRVSSQKNREASGKSLPLTDLDLLQVSFADFFKFQAKQSVPNTLCRIFFTLN